MIPPPEHLNAEARACWYRVQSRLLAMGKWEHEFVLGLGPLAKLCADYMEDARNLRARELHRLKIVDPEEVKAVEKICKNIVEDSRLMARKYLAEFLMIPFDRVSLAVMNAEGLDAEIAELCAPALSLDGLHE